MTALRRRRLASRRPTAKPWGEPYPVAMAIFHAITAEAEATRHGRPFSRLPARTVDEPPALVAAMQDADRMAARLEAERRAA